MDPYHGKSSWWPSHVEKISAVSTVLVLPCGGAGPWTMECVLLTDTRSDKKVSASPGQQEKPSREEGFAQTHGKRACEQLRAAYREINATGPVLPVVMVIGAQVQKPNRKLSAPPIPPQY